MAKIVRWTVKIGIFGTKILDFCPAVGKILGKNPGFRPVDGDFLTFWVDFCRKASGYRPDVTVRQPSGRGNYD